MFNEADYQNPLARFDWRWRLIKAKLDVGKPLGVKDQYAKAGYKFLRDLRNCRNPKDAHSLHDQLEVTLNHPTVAKAFDWFNGMAMYRHYIEAMSLCFDLSMEDQCKDMGMEKEELMMYEKLFFDIREAKKNTTYMYQHVLEPAIIESLRGTISPVFSWRICALFGGYKVVKACFEYNKGDAEVRKFHHDAGISHMMKNFGMAQFGRAVNPYTAPEITAEVLKLLDSEVKKSEGTGAYGSTQQSANLVAAMLSGVSFALPSASDPDLGPRELRFHERLMLAQREQQK